MVAGQAMGTLDATLRREKSGKALQSAFPESTLDAAILLVIQASNAANSQSGANRE
jgi:hypothetical protein